MIKISKEERNWLVSNGVSCGENGVSRTYGHNRHYFLTESKYNLSKLEEYRNSKKVK